MTLSDTPDPLETLELGALMSGGDAVACCASLYANPAVRWVFGDELHPGGEATTRCALALIGLGRGERLLDVASGRGDSAILAAREHGCIVTGIDYGEAAVIDAQRAANAAGVSDQVTFRVGDAETLPFEDGSFDAVLCECSLCLFSVKPRALSEMHRVLRPGGRIAIADVLADHDQLPVSLHGPLASVACVGTALSRAELGQLLHRAGFDVTAEQPCTREAGQLAERVHDRLRGARIVLADKLPGLGSTLAQAIETVAAARVAIDRGALDYVILTAARRESPGPHDEPAMHAT